MKSTVKRWCKDFGYTWYGPGVYGSERYDYKIHFAKGHFAFFRSAHGPSLAPKSYSTARGKQFLIFPVYSQIVGQKEMSKSKFVDVTEWVKACLAGKVCDYPGAASQPRMTPDASTTDEFQR